VSRYFPVIF